jgi:hypothetical protein
VRGATVNFDSYNSPSDNDLVNFFRNPGSLTQTPSGGITGGAVKASGFADTPMYIESFNPLEGLSASMFLKYDNINPAFGSGFSLRVGFTGSDEQGLDILSPTAHFWAEFNNDANLTIWSRGSGNGNGFNMVGSTLPVPFGSWLKLTFSESYVGANQFLLSAILENFGPTGMDAPAALAAGSILVTNSLAGADPSVYAGFGGYYHVSAFDNFGVVPEPGSLALAVLGGFFLRLSRGGFGMERGNRKLLEMDETAPPPVQTHKPDR